MESRVIIILGSGSASLIAKENKILLGLLTNKWAVNGIQVYGLPGRDLLSKEKMGDCVKRNVSEEFGRDVTNYKIICVNANYEWGKTPIWYSYITDKSETNYAMTVVRQAYEAAPDK